MRTRRRSSEPRLLHGGHGAGWFALAAALLGLAAGSAQAADNQKCFDCHSDADLTGTHAGEEMSVFVDEAVFGASVHRNLVCEDCHQDIDPKRRRHSRRADLGPVDCGGCHKSEARAHARSLHGQAAARGDPMAPVCSDCHGKHDILPASNPDAPIAVMNVPRLCGNCHQEGSPVSRTHNIPQEQILQNYSMSIHGEGLYRQGLVVTAVVTFLVTRIARRSLAEATGE